MSGTHIVRVACVAVVFMSFIGCSRTEPPTTPQTGATSHSATTVVEPRSPEPTPVESSQTRIPTVVAPSPQPGTSKDPCDEVTKGWNLNPDSSTPTDESRYPLRPVLGPPHGIVVTSDSCYETVQVNFETPGRVGFTASYANPIYSDGSGEVVTVAGAAALDVHLFAPVDEPQDLRRYNQSFSSSEYQILRELRVVVSYYEGYIQLAVGVSRQVPFAVEHEPMGEGGTIDKVTIRFKV